jgi:hypothetical protein
VLRIAVALVNLYNRGLDDTERLPDLISDRDRYDFRAYGFLPDAYNSLALSAEDGRSLTPEELAAKAEEMTDAFRSQPEQGDTAVIEHEGELYIVGDAVRDLD